MKLSEILNLAALIIIPIVAVVIGRWLQNRSEMHKDKVQVLKAVLTFRYGWSREGVEALNSIPIVFSGKHKDKDVRNCWKAYYDYLCIQKPDDMQVKQRNNALFKLIESMSKALGYKNTVTWEEIQNPYIPVGMVNAINNNEIIQSGMVTLLQGMVINSKTDVGNKEKN